MKQWKRVTAVFLSAALMMLLMAACGPSSEPASSSVPSSSSGSTDSGDGKKDPEAPADSDSDAGKEKTWADSKTMAYFAGRGITPGNVYFTGSYKVAGTGEENYISYYARGTQACLICYMDAEHQQPYQKIYKRNASYYLGIYDEEKGAYTWQIAPLNSVLEFEAVKQVCKIPSSTEPAVMEQKTQGVANTEYVLLSQRSYAFTLNAAGMPVKVKTRYEKDNYEATFTRLTQCPNDLEFEDPTV